MADRDRRRQNHRQDSGRPQSTTADRTSALVAGGLALMAVVGVSTIFSDAIAAVWSPSSTAAAEQSPTSASTSVTATAAPASVATPAAHPVAPATAGAPSP